MEATSWARRTFSSKGKLEESIMTLEKPAWMQRTMSAYSPPWSRLRATGTARGSAMARIMGTMTSGVAWAFIWRGEMSMITGACSAAAAWQMARACSMSVQLMAMTA